MKKPVKLGLLGLAAGAVGLGSAAALGSYLYEKALTPRVRDSARDTDPHDPIVSGRRWLREHPSFRSVRLTAVDGLSLHARILYSDRPDTHRWAICVHGYSDSSEGVGFMARHYAELGWNVLVPDLRGHGQSEGNYVGYGWDDRLDVVAWFSWLIRRDPKASIVLHGISMGAATVLLAAGGPVPGNVRGVVSDCAYTSARDIICHVYQTRRRSVGPVAPVWSALRAVTRRRAGYDLNRADVVAAVSRSSTPTLFIHGVADDFVPATMMGDLYEAAGCPKEFLWVPGAGHGRSAAVAPELYWSTVDDWLSRLPEH